MTIKGELMYEIKTADDIVYLEEGYIRPSNGGLFTAKNALSVLENGNGGLMRATTGRSFGVSHIQSKNQWLRDLLEIK